MSTYLRIGALAGACLPFVLLQVIDGFWKTDLLRGAHIWYWAYDLTAWIFVPLVSLGLLHLFTRLKPRDYGVSTDFGTSDVVYTLAVPFVSLLVINLAAQQIAGRLLGHPEPHFSLGPALDALGPLRIIGTVYLSATAAVCESIFYIGLPWLGFARGRSVTKWHVAFFAVATGLVFCLAHWENGLPNVVGALAFQVLAVAWYVRLKTLWPVIAAHFLIDLYYLW